MPMFEPAGGDHHVAAAEDGRVAGEAPAVGDADPRHEPAQPAPQVERRRVQARDPRCVGVPRPAATALGEEDDGQPPALDDVEQAVLLVVVAEALRARQHGVVVGEDRGGAAVDRADAADQAVGRRAGDQVVERPAAALGGDHQRAVLDERARRRRGRRRSRGRCGGRGRAAWRRPRRGRRRGRSRAGPRPRRGRPAPRVPRRRHRARPGPGRRRAGGGGLAAGPGQRAPPSATTARTSPFWTASPGPTRTSATVPATPASMAYSIFIDSTMTTGVVASTLAPTGRSMRAMVPVSGDRTSAMRVLS